jgi:hypothetical protein
MIAVPGKNAFWLVGLAIGLNFGGVPTAERPVLLSLVPDVEAGRYFSLMLLHARGGDRGPLIWGITVDGLSRARNRDRLSGGSDDRRGDVRDRGIHSSRRSRSICAPGVACTFCFARSRVSHYAGTIGTFTSRASIAFLDAGRWCWW